MKPARINQLSNILKPTFSISFFLSADYIDEIYSTFLDAKKGNALGAAIEELEAMTPAPMNTMLEKQSQSEAIELWKRRKTMVTQEIPRTGEGVTAAEQAIHNQK